MYTPEVKLLQSANSGGSKASTIQSYEPKSTRFDLISKIEKGCLKEKLSHLTITVNHRISSYSMCSTHSKAADLIVQVTT